MKSFLLFGALLSLPLFAATQSAPPALSAIRTQDLRKDVYTLAGAGFRGRSAGTLDELAAAQWLAEQYRAIGLQPAGDNGTYLQYFTIWRNTLAEHSRIRLNGKRLAPWTEVMVTQLAPLRLEAPVLYLGNALQLDTTQELRGKIVVVEAAAAGINLEVSLPTWRYNRYVYAKYGVPLVRRGAAAVVFVADAVAEAAWADAVENAERGTYDIEGGPAEYISATVPVLWLHPAAKAELQKGDSRMELDLTITHVPYPSANVVGLLPGTDAGLKKEYLLYSGHTDAHGIRNVIKGDSIYYGADDNASVNAALLGAARAFVKARPKRSLLFVIHGAEERGLLGSRFYAAHPTVPISSIIAVLNGDMIGRNHPDSAALLGSRPPHRNSKDLVAAALAANAEGPRFRLDTTWDAPSHIEGWYFRSDHLPYARLGIPAVMYTTLLHPDYHTPQDDAARIDYDKLKKMTDWMYRTGWKIANAPQRPVRDPDFKLER